MPEPKPTESADLAAALQPGDVLQAQLVDQAANRLQRFRVLYERFPLDGLALCLTWGMSVPPWLASAFLSSYSQALQLDGTGWESAFGRVPAARTVHTLELSLDAVEAARRVLVEYPNHAIDKLFWDEVGQRIGLGATQAEERYRQAVAEGLAQSAANMRASMKAGD